MPDHILGGNNDGVWYNRCMIREFGLVLAFLASRGEGKICLAGREIFIFISKTGWKLSTKVAEKNSVGLRENFLYPFTSNGSLVVNNGIHLIYDVPKLDRYMSFRNFLKNYLEEAENWCKIFN